LQLFNRMRILQVILAKRRALLRTRRRRTSGIDKEYCLTVLCKNQLSIYHSLSESNLTLHSFSNYQFNEIINSCLVKRNFFLQDEAVAKRWVACHFCTSFVPSETRYVIHRAHAHPTDSRGAIFRSSDHSKLADFKRKQLEEGEAADLRLPCHYCLESFTAQV